MSFVDHVLADLGVPAAYRAKAQADIEVMIGRGFFEHIQLERFIRLLPTEQDTLLWSPG